MTIAPVNQRGIYLTPRYLTRERWASYWQQIEEAINLRPQSILEVGPGNNVVSNTLKELGFLVKTLDIDPGNHPDYLADVSAIAAGQLPQFDLVMACQILEHVEYERALRAVRNLFSVSRRHLIISVPYTARGAVKIYLGLMCLPFFPRRSWLKIFSYWPRRWVYNGVHHWELGSRGHSLKKFLRDISNTGWRVRRHYAVKEQPYHYFIICDKD